MSLTSDNGAMLTMPVAPSGYSGGGFGGNMGGDWFLVLFLIFAMMGGWGNGWGGNGGGGASVQGALTRSDLCQDMNFQEVKREVQNTNDAVNLGFANLNSTICNFAYENAGLINGVNNTIQSGFNATNMAMMQGNNALASQLAQCCCDQRVGQLQLGNQIERSICETNYNAATNTNAIIQNAHNDTDRVIARLDAMEMARKDETIADLRTKLAACGDQTTAQYIINQLTGIISPRAVPAYPASAPCGLGNWAPQVLANTYSYGYGFNNGCGGCGCNG